MTLKCLIRSLEQTWAQNVLPILQLSTHSKAKVIIENSESCQVINFLDVSVILHSDCTIETNIYYKDTNAHDYLPYDSAHQGHTQDNVPCILAKRNA